MRLRPLLVGLCVLPFVTGCDPLRFFLLKPATPNTPPPDVPSVAKLVEYLDQNSVRTQSLRVDDMHVDVNQGFQTFGLQSKMVVQKPLNFRMSGRALGSDQVDLGSNQQEFWWWVRKGDPFQFYCQHKDLSEGKLNAAAFPFQPEWLLEAMYLGSYGPAERYKQEHDAEHIRLIEKIQTPQGRTLRKVIVFDRRRQESPRPQVKEFKLLDDATGKEICFARITETQMEPTTKAVLPKRFELHWPEMKAKLTMRLDHPVSNQNLPQQAFIRPTLPGIPSWNLANGLPGPGNLQAVQGSGQ